jgi:predicted alpha/beta superfamily hydrolase
MISKTNKYRMVIGVPVFLVLTFFLFIEKDKGKSSLYSQVLDERRHIQVYLPEGYESSDTRYPVLFHLDGGSTKLHSRYIPHYNRAIETLKKLHLSNDIILVGVANANRSRDMLPVKSKWNFDGGGAHFFLRFLKEELKPHIDTHYRTNGFTILYGMSDSGLFTIYALLESPQTFSAYIASSPSLGWCPRLIKEKAKTLLQNRNFPETSLYIIYGKKDSKFVTAHVPDFVWLINHYQHQGFHFEVKKVEHAGHIPPSSLFDGLTFTLKTKLHH